MKVGYLRPALQYAFQKQKKSLSAVVSEDKDAPMAIYLLECRPRIFNAASLGIGLIYMVEEAGSGHKGWLEAVSSLRRHEASSGIAVSLLASALISCAVHKNTGLMQELLSFPQASMISADQWDQVRFEALPPGDPEKKRIEKRDFVDGEGSPEILEMITRHMAQSALHVAPSAEGKIAPRANGNAPNKI